jgi:FAD synthase
MITFVLILLGIVVIAWGAMYAWEWCKCFMYQSKEIKGTVMPGTGTATKMGYPTINVSTVECRPGVYKVQHEKHGDGYAFVTEPKVAEVHFLKEDITHEDPTLTCQIVERMENYGNGFIQAMYRGLKSR